jgi:hypothetical protein
LSYPTAYLIEARFNTPNKQNWILKKAGEQYDYAVLGASRVFNMVDINTLDSVMNKKGINIGSSGSCYAENYIILEEFLSKNKISALLLNTDEFSFNSANSYSYPFHDYEFLPVFRKHKEVFFDFIPSWKYYLWLSVPCTKYIEYNDQYVLSTLSNRKLNKTKGTELLYGKRSDKNLLLNKRRVPEINRLDAKYFKKIADLCANKNIALILITTPIFKYDREEHKLFLEYIDSFSQQNNLKYYSFETLIDASKPDYFQDNTHTNNLGSVEYSKRLGQKLKEEGLSR